MGIRLGIYDIYVNREGNMRIKKSESIIFGLYEFECCLDCKGVCFCIQIYQILGTVVYLAMSGDSTCRGLRSPRDGPLVMEFTKGKDSNI